MDSQSAKSKFELTDRFLKGELSFGEYSERWSTEDGEEAEPDEADEAEAEAEVEGTEAEKKKEERVIRRRTRTQLPPALAGLMGEANLRCARGERAAAEKMCYEIVRQMPTASEPFRTLAHIYEADAAKALQFSLIAAHLDPHEPEQWLRLADASEAAGDPRQAALCYTKAIAADPRNVAAHERRLELVARLAERRSAPTGLTVSQCRLRMIRFMPDERAREAIELAEAVARDHHAAGELAKACAAVERAHRRWPHLFGYEDLNLYFELLLALGRHERCLELLVAHCGVEIEEEAVVMEDGRAERNVLSCSVPAELPIDLRAKLIACLVRANALELVDSFVDDLLETSRADDAGDVYLDVEEALTAEGLHSRALRLLGALVASAKFDLPAVWLKYAECLTALERDADAMRAYRSVVRLAPQHVDARLRLADMLAARGRDGEALAALEQNQVTDALDAALLARRCALLKRVGDLDAYLDAGRLLLSRHFYTVRNRDELVLLRRTSPQEHLRQSRSERHEPLEEINDPVFQESEPRASPQAEWELLGDLFETAHRAKRFAVLEHLAFSALGSKRFQDRRQELEIVCALACYRNKEYGDAFGLVRELVVRHKRCVGLVNFLNLIVNRRPTNRKSNKHLIRLHRATDNPQLKLMFGNHCLSSGTYKQALAEYLADFRANDSPMSALLCAVTVCHMASQKFTYKHPLVVQCFAFMSKYEKLRGPGARQEIYYNTGRAYHELGLIYHAARFYKMALEVEIEYEEALDLKREIAYNLHLIYSNTAPELARMYLLKYIVV